MACEAVGVLEWVLYEHDQALQPFNVEERFGRWNAAINSSKKKVIQRAVVSGFEAKINLSDSVDVLMCWFEVKKI